MNIQVQRTTETLNQGNCPCVSGRFCITGFPSQVRSNGAVDNTRRLAHDFGLAGEQEPERERYAEHPLAHGLMGQYLVNQQGGTFCHTTCPATGTEAAAGFPASWQLQHNRIHAIRCLAETIRRKPVQHL